MSQYAINKIKEEQIEDARRRGGEVAAQQVRDRHNKEASNIFKYAAAGANIGSVAGFEGKVLGGIIGGIWGMLKMEP